MADAEQLARLRHEYEETGIDDATLEGDPGEVFSSWFDQAIEAGCTEPNAMVVSTVSADGWPSARNVLLKGLDETGFIFYTNYQSDKGTDLAANPRASLTFSWLQLHRQVRVGGSCVPVPTEVSDQYFALRPRGSQLGAWASDQSRPVDSRAALEQRFADLEAEWEGRDVERPPHWGGFVVQPRLIEFWQGRKNRMHDRIVYRLGDDGTWNRSRLNP